MTRTITLLFFTLFFSVAATMAEASSGYRKTGANIRLVSPKLIRLEPFSQTSVTLEFSAPHTGELLLRAKAGQGIILAEQNAEYLFDLNADNPSITLTLQSLEAGRYYIMFDADIRNAEISNGRVFGVAVQVGPEQIQTENEKPRSPYIIMQGKERVQ